MDIGAILETLIRFLPRLNTVDTNERGVFLRCGKIRKVRRSKKAQNTLEPGMYFCWPIIDKVMTLDITPQAINLPNQSITTADGISLAVSGVIEYEIEDAARAMFCVQDFDKSLQNVAMGIIGEHTSKHSYDDCRRLEKIQELVVAGLQDTAKNWGLKILRFWVTDLVEHRVYRILSHETPVVLPESRHDE